MREIKFRVWDKEKKEWIKGEHLLFDSLSGQVFNVSRRNDNKETDENVELIQYTGLKDKNGKQIYESDRVNYRVGGAAASTHEGVVQWFDYYWGVQKGFGFGLLQDVEVTGNIYEN